MIFVVDSNDRDRFDDACKMLKQQVSQPNWPLGVPVLILANKQDSPVSVYLSVRSFGGSNG
jgi:signal recognition particle receptor subunit beta